MCVIFTLNPNQNIPFEMLENAVYNNWHSFGMIVMGGNEDGSPLVIKHCPEKELDPIWVQGQINKYPNHLRHIHLRHNTAGATNDENTHPFEVYNDNGKQVWFMHNGTLSEFKSKKENQWGNWVPDPDSPVSDTSNFCNKILRPYLRSLIDHDNEFGNIQNPLLIQLIYRAWASDNRGLLVSNVQSPVYIGLWKQVGLDKDIKASNDLYFTEVKRGPEKDRRDALAKAEKEAREKLEAKAAGSKSTAVINVVHDDVIKLSEFKAPTVHSYGIMERLEDFLGVEDVTDIDLLSNVAYLTNAELMELTKDKDTCVALMSHVFAQFMGVVDENQSLATKKKSAERHIAALKQQIAELQQAEQIEKEVA